MKHKITIFIPSLKGGGAERVAVNIANHLDATKYQVSLLSLRQSVQDKIENYDIAPHVEIKELKVMSLRKSIPRLLMYFRSNTPDLLISHMSLTNIVALIARKLSLKKFPIIVVEHSTPSIKYQSEGWHRRAIPWLMRFTYKNAEEIVAVSDGVREDLARLIGVPSAKIRRIYNPVVTNTITEKALEPVNHRWLCQNNKYKVILGVGRLEKVKNFKMLIDAFKYVYQHEKNARLIILGEGTERKNLEYYISKLGLNDVIDLPGFVANPFSYLLRASVFVLSSNFEGLPTVLIEAMAVGTQVIATDCPSGPKEILDGGKYGHLISKGDWNSLANILLDILSENSLKHIPRQMLIERAKEFSVDVAIKQYEETIDSLLHKNKIILSGREAE